MQEYTETLLSSARGLPLERILILIEMAKALNRQVSSTVNETSDIVTNQFNVDFTGRLLLFHAMHDAPLTKKTFEFFFCGASRASEKTAVQTANSVHPGEDVTVNNQKFSLKTESGSAIKRDEIHISKLMEARWIRECRTPIDFRNNVLHRVVEHLSGYERIISLRSFDSGQKRIEYELVEIPRRLLMEIKSLKASDFSARTTNGSTSARVTNKSGSRVFTLALDGSVEKVTVRSLKISQCIIHGRWLIDTK